MKNAFEILFQMSNPRKPDKLQTEAGKEFLNKKVQKFLKSHGVLHFVSHSEKKAAVVERFNRTLKTKIWTDFTEERKENLRKAQWVEWRSMDNALCGITKVSKPAM